ncbi:MAG: glycosyltransferase family 2 protein [bacterium]
MLFPRDMPRLLSVVVPVYNEVEVIPRLREEMAKLNDALGCPLEIILVDDGSDDGTTEKVCAWAGESPHVRVAVLSRNFGHQIAITAGMDLAAGDAVVIMDADLQDPPELVPEMLKGYCEGYDVVYGQRVERAGETFFKLFTANFFYWLMKKFLLPGLPVNAGDFRLISREVLEGLKRMEETDRFLRGLTAWVGYKQKALPYRRAPRAAGVTKYPFLKMLRFAADAILSFSDLPLRLIIWFGMLSVLLSGVLTARIFYLFYTGNEGLVRGWSSISVSIFFFSGVILISMGVMGMYVGRIHREVKRRPLYLVRKTFNVEERCGDGRRTQ